MASRQPNAFDGTGVSAGVVLFVEPETREGRALTELYLRDGFGSVDRSVVAGAIAELFVAFRERRGDAAIAAAARRVVNVLTGGIEPLVVSDERILRAVAYVNAHLGRTVTLNEVAADACLSPSRLRHLFVEQTGMGLRQYVLWRRFMHVRELIMRGVSLSPAAHEAGVRGLGAFVADVEADDWGGAEWVSSVGEAGGVGGVEVGSGSKVLRSRCTVPTC